MKLDIVEVASGITTQINLPLNTSLLFTTLYNYEHNWQDVT